VTYVLAFGLVLFGVCFGAVIEHLFSGTSQVDLEHDLFVLEIENARLRREGH
jgi:hypothetical protein